MRSAFTLSLAVVALAFVAAAAPYWYWFTHEQQGSLSLSPYAWAQFAVYWACTALPIVAGIGVAIWSASVIERTYHQQIRSLFQDIRLAMPQPPAPGQPFPPPSADFFLYVFAITADQLQLVEASLRPKWLMRNARRQLELQVRILLAPVAVEAGEQGLSFDDWLSRRAQADGRLDSIWRLSQALKSS